MLRSRTWAFGWPRINTSDDYFLSTNNHLGILRRTRAFMIHTTTNTYEEVYTQLKGSIIAGDKNGNGVKVGDIVKVGRKKDLYCIHKIIPVDDGNNGEPYPIFELAPLEPQTIFRGEDQIELQ